MKRPALSPRDRRAATLGGVVVAGALLVRVVLLPYSRAVEDARAAMLRERELFARERALVAEARAFPREFGALGERFLAGVPRLLPGGTAATAHAALARRVDRLAAESPALLTRLEPLPPRARQDGYVELPLQVEGESDLEGLLALLAALETGPTLVHLEDLAMERKGRTGPGERAGEAESLAFRFTAVGFGLETPPGEPAAGEAR